MRQDPRSEIPNLLLEGRGRRTLVRIVVAAGVALAIGLAVWLGVSRMRRSKLRRVDGAFQALSTCLLGESPADGERPSDRLHAIELARRHDPSLDDGPVRWPNRCATYAQAVYDGLVSAGVAGDSAAGRLRDTAFGVAGILEGGKLPVEPDALWTAARAADLPHGDTVRVRLPLAPIHPALELARLPALGTNVLELAATDQQARHLHVLLSRGPDDLTLCRFDKAAATCFAVPAAVPRSVGNLGLIEIDGAPDDALISIWGAGEQDGLYRARAGTRVWGGNGGVPLAGVAHGDDFTLLMTLADKSVVVRQVAGALVTLPLEQTFAPSLMGDDVLWTAAAEGQPPHLMRRALADWKAPAQDLGTFGSSWGATPAGACLGPPRTLVYRAGDSGLLVVEGQPAAVPVAPPHGDRYWMTCAAGVATFTWNDFAEAHQLRCGGKLCTPADAAMTGVPTDATLTAIADRLIALWSSDVELPGTGRDGEHGLLWLRSAAITDFARTPDTLLVAGGAHLHSVHPDGDRMVALITGDDGKAFLLSIDGQGGVTPVHILNR